MENTISEIQRISAEQAAIQSGFVLDENGLWTTPEAIELRKQWGVKNVHDECGHEWRAYGKTSFCPGCGAKLKLSEERKFLVELYTQTMAARRVLGLSEDWPKELDEILNRVGEFYPGKDKEEP